VIDFEINFQNVCENFCMIQCYTKMSNELDIGYDSPQEDDILQEAREVSSIDDEPVKKYKNKKGDLKKKASIAKQNLAKGRAKKAENQKKKREQEADSTKYTVKHEEEASDVESDEGSESDDDYGFVLTKESGKVRKQEMKPKRKVEEKSIDTSRLDKLESILIQMVQDQKQKKKAKAIKKQAKPSKPKKETIILVQPDKKKEIGNQPMDLFESLRSSVMK
jgi:hypothetical protein